MTLKTITDIDDTTYVDTGMEENEEYVFTVVTVFTVGPLVESAPVVVDDSHIMRRASGPTENNAPLVVDSDAVKSTKIAPKAKERSDAEKTEAGCPQGQGGAAAAA